MSSSKHLNHNVIMRVFDRDSNPYEFRCLDCLCHIKWASKKEYREHMFLKKEVKKIEGNNFNLLFSSE